MAGSSTWIDAVGNQFTDSTEGTTNYEYRALDNAGNASDTGNCAVTYQTSVKPLVSDNADTAWHNTAVTVTIAAVDRSGSGISKIQYRLSGPSTPTWINATWVDATHASFIVSAPSNHSNDGAHAYRYRAIDNAGNMSDTGTCTVNIDTSGPTVSDNAPAGWNNAAVTVTLSAADSLAGLDKTQYRLAGSSTWIDGSSFIVAAPADHSNDGVHNYEYRALDNIGNVSTGACTVRIDTTSPTVTDNAPAGWSASDVTVTLSPTDGGSGIAKTQYRRSSPADPTWHDLDSSNQFVVAAAADHSNDGANVYRYRAIDNAGNVSGIGICTVRIDTTGPTVTDNAPAGWKKSAVTVTLTATDSGSGMSGGLAKTQYRLAGSTTWTDTTANTFTVAAPADHSNDGINNYEYRAIDNVGNVSATGTCAVKIDTTNPTVSDNAPAGWSSTDVTVTITALDAGSGVGKIQYRLSGPATPTWIDATRIDANHAQFTVVASPDHLQRRCLGLPVPRARQHRQYQRQRHLHGTDKHSVKRQTDRARAVFSPA